MTYGVFKTVPAKPPMAPDTKLFMSCACGLCAENDIKKSQMIDFRGQNKIK